MPLKNAQQIATQLRPHVQANNASIAPSELVTMYLGDGQGNTRPPTLITARDVYVRSDQSQNDRGVAVLDPSFPIPIDAIDGFYNTPVICGKKPRSNYLYVIELADGTGATLPRGAMPTDALIRQAGFPSQDRFVIFRIGPSLDGGLSINIDLGIYAAAVSIGGGLYDFVQSVDLDLSDPTNAEIYVPAATALSSGEHRIVAIAESPLDGKYIAIAGTALTAENTLGSQDARSEFSEDDYKAIDLTGYVPCGYVYQYFEQTEFTEDDCLRLYDPRQFLRPNGLERWGVTDVTDDYTLLPSDNILLVDTTSAREITLGTPSSYPRGLGYLIKDFTGNASADNITVTGDIDGDSSKIIDTDYGALLIFPTIDKFIAFSSGGGSGGVTSVDTGTGLAGGPITTTGTLIATPAFYIPCRAVAVANVTVSSPGATIDSVSLSSGDRVLLTAQSTGSQNGIWTWNGAAVPMTRPVDYAASSTVLAYVHATVFVYNGTVYQGSSWRLTTTGAITIDTTTTAWSLNNNVYTQHEHLYPVNGSLSISTGVIRMPNIFGKTLTVKKVYIIVATAPTGASIIVDVHKNGTTIFTNQANRPTIAASGTTGSTTTIDVPIWADGDYFTFDIDQVGSTIAGQNLTIAVLTEG